MKKEKIIEELTYTQYMEQCGKSHRFCVRFSVPGRTISMDYYQTLPEAQANALYTSFETVWTDSPLIYKDYPPEKEAERVEIMEWSEPTRRDAQVLLTAKTEQKRIKVIENLFRKYGNTLALKASFFLKEKKTKKKGDYIKGLYCLSNPSQVNVIGSIPPVSYVPQQPGLNVVSN